MTDSFQSFGSNNIVRTPLEKVENLSVSRTRLCLRVSPHQSFSKGLNRVRLDRSGRSIEDIMIGKNDQ